MNCRSRVVIPGACPRLTGMTGNLLFVICENAGWEGLRVILSETKDPVKSWKKG
ncbi:MAG: hypothetical protein J6W51_07780 [Fibrobacter sp.]|nr:hypothetical protein [Fibrobacter sp.]